MFPNLRQIIRHKKNRPTIRQGVPFATNRRKITQRCNRKIPQSLIHPTQIRTFTKRPPFNSRPSSAHASSEPLAEVAARRRARSVSVLMQLCSMTSGQVPRAAWRFVVLPRLVTSLGRVKNLAGASLNITAQPDSSSTFRAEGVPR